MAILVKGKTFTSTEQVTSTKLHQLVDSATFDPAAADGSTLEVSSGALRIKDAGVTGAKLSPTVAIPSGATATTQSPDTNTTAIATTAFAKKEADDAQAYSIQRANHTGTQDVSTITGLGTAATASSAQLCKAWVCFTSITTTAVKGTPFNVSSLTDNGTGDTTINFSSAMANANYAAQVSGLSFSTTDTTRIYLISGTIGTGPTLKSTTQLRVVSGSSASASLVDSAECCVSIFSN